MKRALAIAVALCTLGFAGFSQFTGSWTATVGLIPSPPVTLSTTLVLNYAVSGWTLTSTSKFDLTGFTAQSFGLKGLFGPFTVTGAMVFLPANLTLKDTKQTPAQPAEWVIVAPAYRSASLTSEFDFGGLGLKLAVSHTAHHVGKFELLKVATGVGAEWDINACYHKWYMGATDAEKIVTKVSAYDAAGALLGTVTGPFDWTAYDPTTKIITIPADQMDFVKLTYPTAVTLKAEPADVQVWWLLPSYMLYTLTAKIAPVEVVLRFDDVCTGTQFLDATFKLKGVELCCGVKYDFMFAFNKCLGFDYAKFSATGLFPICCGITFDASITFKTDAKIVELKPVFAGFGEACLTLYAQIESTGGLNTDLYLDSIRIDGWKIKCTIGDCNYLEFVTFLSPANVGLYYTTNPFVGTEYEYVKLGFCGPGCCGGKYAVDIAVFFGPGGTLFDITRIVANFSIPLMTNFTVTGAFAVGTNPVDTKLSIGWTFTF